MTKKIRYIVNRNVKDVSAYEKLAKGTSVTFAIPKRGDCYWFEALDGDFLVGILALTSGGRIKSVFVHPDYRMRGIFRSLLSISVEYAREQLKLKRLTAFASSMSFPHFKASGWNTTGKTKASTIIELKL